MVAETKNVLVVLVTRAFLFGPVSVEKCNHRHTILGRKWAQLFEDRFSLTRGVISFSFVLKHFLRQFSPFFFFSEYPTIKLYTKRIKLNRTYSLFFWPSQLKKKQSANCSQPRPQGFSLKNPPHPFFKGKALGTRLNCSAT